MALKSGQQIEVIDSHTGGEPTRVVWRGGPDLGQGSMADRLAVLRDRFDRYRSALVNEPRGSDVLVGAWLVAPTRPDCVAGVIFFNNVGYLNMCGHGMIGVAATLAHQGRLQPGIHRLETPAGVVTVTLHESGEVSVANVASYRLARQVKVQVPDGGPVTGDVAWGGNWFFLVEDHGQELTLANVGTLTGFTSRIRQALGREGVTGTEGAEIDHIELFGPPMRPEAHSRNFVLCPGLAYDRSPCGTGTSAKLACLAADGKLAEEEVWIQESIVGSTFAARYRREPGGERILPTITGRAYVTGEATLLLDEEDPFCWGMKPQGDASPLCES